MSFKQNKPSPFMPSLDPFGGRGTQGGLNHGGQYSVDFILNQAPKAQISRPSQSGRASYLNDAPPVPAPRPTRRKSARGQMKSATGQFKNIVSAKEKEELRELLKGYTCFRKPKDGFFESCPMVTPCIWWVKASANKVNRLLINLTSVQMDFLETKFKHLKNALTTKWNCRGIVRVSTRKIWENIS